MLIKILDKVVKGHKGSWHTSVSAERKPCVLGIAETTVLRSLTLTSATFLHSLTLIPKSPYCGGGIRHTPCPTLRFGCPQGLPPLHSARWRICYKMCSKSALHLFKCVIHSYKNYLCLASYSLIKDHRLCKLSGLCPQMRYEERKLYSCSCIYKIKDGREIIMMGTILFALIVIWAFKDDWQESFKFIIIYNNSSRIKWCLTENWERAKIF